MPRIIHGDDDQIVPVDTSASGAWPLAAWDGGGAVGANHGTAHWPPTSTARQISKETSWNATRSPKSFWTFSKRGVGEWNRESGPKPSVAAGDHGDAQATPGCDPAFTPQLSPDQLPAADPVAPGSREPARDLGGGRGGASGGR